MGLFGPPNVEKMKAKKDIKGLTKALSYQKDDSVCRSAAFALTEIGSSEAIDALKNSRAIEWLIATLEDENDANRSFAAEVLGRIGDSRAVEPLIATLNDEESYVRRSAADALGEIGDARAVEPLIAGLRNEPQSFPGTRGSIVRALGQMGDARATEPLTEALSDPRPEVRKAAAEALDNLGWQPDQGAAGAAYWVIKFDYSRCVPIGAPAVEPLIAVLLDPAMHRDWHARAAKALGEIGDARAIKPLIAMFKDRRHPGEVVRALRQIGAPAVKPLAAALKDRDPNVRGTAAFTLEGIDDARAIKPLIAALKDKDEDVRKAAARTLNIISGNHPGEVEPFIAALKDEDANVRTHAAGVLGRLRDASAVKPLMTALKNKDQNVRSLAAEALGKIGDAQAVEALIAALQDANGDLRLKATIALDEIGDARAVEPLIAALQDPNGDVRLKATIALCKMGDAHVVEPLIAALQDANSDVRGEAAIALRKIGDTRAVEPLIAALQDPNGDVRRKAAFALGKLGDVRAVEPLTRALGDSDQDVCSSAAAALKALGDSQGVAAAAAYQERAAGQPAQYRLTATCLGNPLDLRVATERLCVYCTHLRDPNLRDPTYPKGVGESANYGSGKSVVSFDDTCEDWTPNTKVRFWLSKGYLEHNLEGWPRKPWYQVFDDGPDGEKGTR